MAGTVKRPYNSTRRREQAEETRARILDAAHEVFLDRGYERASIAAIAAAAGVADETVYGHFRNKRTLLGELVKRSVRGRDPRPVLQQDGPRRLADAPNQRRRLELFATDVTARLDRGTPLLRLVAAAAPGEPELAELLDRLHADRLKNLRMLVDVLAANGELRLPRRAATETVWALASPELYHLLTGVRGWSRGRYTAWLADSLESLLLEPRPTAAR